MRHAPWVAVLGAALVVQSSCSLAMKRPEGAHSEAMKCSSSYEAPVFDGIGGSLAAAGFLRLALWRVDAQTYYDSDIDAIRKIRAAGMLSTGLVSLAYLVSAYRGVSVARECRAYRRRHRRPAQVRVSAPE